MSPGLRSKNRMEWSIGNVSGGLEGKEGVEEQVIEARTYSQIDVEQPRYS